jgi:hypothetical protein
MAIERYRQLLPRPCRTPDSDGLVTLQYRMVAEHMGKADVGRVYLSVRHQ